MIRLERDPAFWATIASHPALAHVLGALTPTVIGQLASRADVLPLAADHGGFFFVRLDSIGLVAELHTLFTPAGWGREALQAGIEAINAVWICGFQLITTMEIAANPRSRPPRSFGFIAAGDDWRPTPIGPAKLWTLSRAGWAASPGMRRRACLLH